MTDTPTIPKKAATQKAAFNSTRQSQMLAEMARLKDELEKAQAENERLRKALEEALRSLKRQAAPFSKGEPKADPKRPGRKRGSGYGQRAFRAVPEHVDQELAVPLQSLF